MKKLSIMALAAAGLLVTACSTKDSIEADNGVNLDGKGKGYLNVSVNLPTQANVSTRGWQEPAQFHDGDDTNYGEYSVDNVLLAVFGGSDEASATLQQVVTQSANWNNNGDDPNQITKTSDNIVFQLDDAVAGAHLYILAALNYTDVLEVSGNTITTKGGTPVKVTTIGSLQNAQIETTNASTPFRNTDKHFFMTNAVLSNKNYSAGVALNAGNNAVVLAPVTTIYESESAAEAADAKPSAEIFVERGLAKVEVKVGNTLTVGVKDAKGGAPSVELDGWVLDNTNLKSFIARNTYNDTQWGLFSDYATEVGNDRFRFVGYNPTKKAAAPGANQTPSNVDEDGNPLYYRSYWANDPNYSNDLDTKELLGANFYEPATKAYARGADASKPQYCFENTFDVAHQAYKYTTRAVVAMKFGDGDFYTLNNDRKTLYTLADVQDMAKSALMLQSDFVTWFNTNFSGKTLKGENITMNWAKDKAGRVHAKSFTISIDGTVKIFGEPTDETKTRAEQAIVKEVNTSLTAINRYKGGIAYYAIRIKHFGDDLTPWGGHGEAESTIATIYPGSQGPQDAHYLGRYGVLRNNWYILEIGDVAKIGHPIVPWLNPGNDPNDPKNPDNPDPTDPDPNNPDDPDPENPDHPDDSLDDTYLSAKIHILSWAKRPQGVILK